MARTTALALLSKGILISLLAGQAMAQAPASTANTPAPTNPAPAPTGDPLPPRPGQLSPAPAQPMGPSGRFTPEEKVFNFGKILSSNSVEHIFKFKNTGDATLIITSATGSCHCTVPTLTKTQYEPGEAGEIKVIFDPKGKAAGQVQQRVTVVSNDPTSPTSSLTIEADVQPIVTVEPRLVAFNQLTKGESKSVDLTVTGRIDNFNVTEIKFDGAGEDIKAEIGKPEQIEINNEKMYKVPVKLTYPPAKRIERFNRNMIIVTNDSREKEVKLPVLGEVVGDIDVKPPRVTMGLVAREAQFSNTASLASRTGKPFKVLGVKQVGVQGRNDPALTFDIKPVNKAGKPVEGASSDNFTIAISGTALKEQYRGVIDCEVQTDVPGEETVKLGVYIVVR